MRWLDTVANQRVHSAHRQSGQPALAAEITHWGPLPRHVITHRVMLKIKAARSAFSITTRCCPTYKVVQRETPADWRRMFYKQLKRKYGHNEVGYPPVDSREA
ncbi:MAG: hypothetical protein PHY78_15780 [Desulfobacterales bacterium]|nr:hypothetical protein [Desulfobacterales bacterium]